MRIKSVPYYLLCTLGLVVLLANPLAAIGRDRAEPAEPAPVHEEPASPRVGPTATVPWTFEVVDDGHNINSIGNRSLAIDAAGRLHATYAGEHLYYAYHNGTSWQSSIVDPDGASCPSMALDSAGQPRIAYYNQANSSLDYARYDGSAWVTETVLQLPQYALCPSLALDAGDVPHVSVCPAHDGWHCYSLWYAWQEGAGWSVQVVREGSESMGGQTALALNTAGQPRIAFKYNYSPTGLVYAAYESSAWTFTYLEHGYIDGDIALTMDGTDRPHLLYGTNGLADLRYASWDGSAWVTATVASGAGVGEYLSLALNAAHHSGRHRGRRQRLGPRRSWPAATARLRAESGPGVRPRRRRRLAGRADRRVPHRTGGNRYVHRVGCGRPAARQLP
jgi:hypothetical protein